MTDPPTDQRKSPKRRPHSLRVPRLHHHQPGAAPGCTPDQLAAAAAASPASEPAAVTVYDIAPDRIEDHDVRDTRTFFAGQRPDWAVTRWINVCGLNDLSLIQQLAEVYNLHPLAVEDVLRVPQRPKLDSYDRGESRPDHPGPHPAQLFMIAKMITFDEPAQRVDIEQVSIFLGSDTVITFQEHPGDVFGPIRERLHNPASRLRQQDASFLFYALFDAIVDHYYPVLESLARRLEAIDDVVYTSTDRKLLAQLHDLKRQLLLMRREVWPMRDVCAELLRDNHPALAEHTRTYLRDVMDHVVQVIDLLETYRDLANGLADAYMNTLSTHMNEVMKVLTIVAALFIPISFLAGVFGMNFDFIPGLHTHSGFALFCFACIAICTGMLWWFKRKKWL